MSLVVYGNCRPRAVAVFPAIGADDDQLRGAPARVTGLLRPGGVDAERQSEDKAATGRQGVPVVLPVREGSPGGSYGTAAEGRVSVLRCSRLGFALTERQPMLTSDGGMPVQSQEDGGLSDDSREPVGSVFRKLTPS